VAYVVVYKYIQYIYWVVQKNAHKIKNVLIYSIVGFSSWNFYMLIMGLLSKGVQILSQVFISCCCNRSSRSLFPFHCSGRFKFFLPNIGTELSTHHKRNNYTNRQNQKNVRPLMITTILPYALSISYKLSSWSLLITTLSLLENTMMMQPMTLNSDVKLKRQRQLIYRNFHDRTTTSIFRFDNIFFKFHDQSAINHHAFSKQLRNDIFEKFFLKQCQSLNIANLA